MRWRTKRLRPGPVASGYDWRKAALTRRMLLPAAYVLSPFFSGALWMSVKGTSPCRTSSRAMLVFLRRCASASIRGCAPRWSCLALKEATMIRRNRDSVFERSASSAPLSLLVVSSVVIISQFNSRIILLGHKGRMAGRFILSRRHAPSLCRRRSDTHWLGYAGPSRHIAGIGWRAASLRPCPCRRRPDTRPRSRRRTSVCPSPRTTHMSPARYFFVVGSLLILSGKSTFADRAPGERQR